MFFSRGKPTAFFTHPPWSYPFASGQDVAQTRHLPWLANCGHQRGGHQRNDIGALVRELDLNLGWLVKWQATTIYSLPKICKNMWCFFHDVEGVSYSIISQSSWIENTGGQKQGFWSCSSCRFLWLKREELGFDLLQAIKSGLLTSTDGFMLSKRSDLQ